MDRLKDFLNLSLKIEAPNLSFEDSVNSESSLISEEEEVPEEMSFGNIEPFIEGSSIIEYLERFEAFCTIKKINDDKEKSIMLVGVSGAFLYSKIRTVCAPTAPVDMRFSVLKPLLHTALKPKSIEVVERAKFGSRHQRIDEDACSYALVLREYAQSCNFGDSLDSQLRDKFVIGLKDDAMRRRVISSQPATFDEAIAAAQTNEISVEIAGPSQQNLHRFGVRSRSFSHQHTRGRFNDRRTGNRNGNRVQKCVHCGSSFHREEFCRMKASRCFNCHEVGHIKRACSKVFGVRNMDEQLEDNEEQYKLGTFRTLTSGKRLQIRSTSEELELHPSDTEF